MNESSQAAASAPGDVSANQEATTGPQKPWRRGALVKLNKSIQDSLYQVYNQVNKQTREDIGLMMKIPVFIKDPLIAQQNPVLGIQEISVRLESGIGDGPTSSRVAVVDFNTDTQTLTGPITWDHLEGWFNSPDGWIPTPVDLPKDSSKIKNIQKYEKKYRAFIEQTVKNPYFHQLNVWAIVQRVLEFYEEPQAMGRPIPWGFDGNRLIVIPHAGYGENAFYDRRDKCLKFFYFGDEAAPGYTSLSHDIITHETGHAILDGIRPYYNQISSLQTAAFHEFIGDLTAMLLALFNEDIRHSVAKMEGDWLSKATVLADLAPEFGQEVEGRPYLRTAFNKLTLLDEKVKDSLSPHNVSQVMTGAMWEILVGIAQKHMAKNAAGNGTEQPEDEPGEDDFSTGQSLKPRKVTQAQALWWAADRFRRIALQPLDLCPPCDIQFIDYAKAVIRNDILTNPVDEQGYRQAMLQVFHQRGLCTCGYQEGDDLPKGCQFADVFRQERMDLIYPDIERVSRSHTAAYYFLSDNRKALRIPQHQDVSVVDLYDTNKFGAAAERLPREVVLEYAWQEEILLQNNPKAKLNFGPLNGKKYFLNCGGTLVFDGRGNVLSWFRKPGTEHITEAEEQDIHIRKAAWKKSAKTAKENKLKCPTKLELATLEDLAIGRDRKKALLNYLSQLLQRGLVRSAAIQTHLSEESMPITAIIEGDALLLEAVPYLRKSDFDRM